MLFFFVQGFIKAESAGALLLDNRCLSNLFDQQRSKLFLMDGNLIDLIGVIPERDLIILEVELRLVRTLWV